MKNVRDFDARPVPGFDNRLAFNRAIIAAQPGEVILFPPGIYETSFWRSGDPPARDVVLKGDGATVKLMDDQHKHAKAFMLTGLCRIESLNWDGNFRNQVFEEHNGEPQSPWSRQWQAFAVINDGALDVIDCRGDDGANFIWAQESSNTNLARCTATRFLRGGWVLSPDPGNRGRHTLTDCDFNRLDIEPNGLWNYDTTLTRCRIQLMQATEMGPFDHLRLHDCLIDDLVVLSDGNLTAKDCRFGEVFLKKCGTHFSFANCTFAEELQYEWRDRTDRRLFFDRCRFVGAGEEAVQCGYDFLGKRNRACFTNCLFSGFSTGINLRRGGRLEVRGCEFDTQRAMALTWTSNKKYYVTLEDNRFTQNCNTYWYSIFDHPENTVEHRNQRMKPLNFTTKRGMYKQGANRYIGNRIIEGTHAPDNTTEGIPGDFWDYNGQRWLCITGSYGIQDAHWEPVS